MSKIPEKYKNAILYVNGNYQVFDEAQLWLAEFKNLQMAIDFLEWYIVRYLK